MTSIPILQTTLLAATLLFGADNAPLAATNDPSLAVPANAASTRPSVESANAPPAPAAFQTELLDLSFATASAIPVNPHIKDRSRSQEAVVAACIELGDTDRARAFLQKIENWRRGVCLADLAFFSAQHGDLSRVEQDLESAALVGKGEEDWRRDRVRVAIAKTYILLGRQDDAAKYETNLVDAEIGKVDAVRAAVSPDDQFDRLLNDFEAMAVTGSFDQIRNAVDAFVALHKRFFDQPDRRKLVEEKLTAALERVPQVIRVSTLISLARTAAENSDRPEALRFVERAQAIVDGAVWAPENLIPVNADLAAVRFAAGDVERARRDADAVLPLFESNREKLLSIDRADVVRSLAETYMTLGDRAAAAKIYLRAIDEGLVNPNSRPRAEDLAAICTSMALKAFEPDADLWARIREAQRRLGPPW